MYTPNTPSVPSPASGKAAKEGRARGSPKKRTRAAAWQVDAGPSCPASVVVRSRLGRDTTLSPAKSPVLQPCVFSPAHFSSTGSANPSRGGAG
jgi:hypothetical protein